MIRNEVAPCRYLLGIVVLACMVAGGGTVRDLAVDAVLQIGIIAASTCAVIILWKRPTSFLGLALFVLVFLSGLLQLVPLPLGLLQGLRPSVFQPEIAAAASDLAHSTISIGTSRTLSAWMNCLAIIYLFIAMSKLNERELLGLLPFYLAGLTANIMVVFIGYSRDLQAGIGTVFGYEAGAGFFANDNHLSTLLCAGVPVVTYFGSRMRRRWVSHLLLICILISLLAVGSRAGMLIGCAVVTLSLLQSAWGSRVGGLVAIGLLIVATAYGYGVFVRIGGDEAETMLQRQDFAFTTLRAIRENWLLGTGYGTFTLAYPHYERLQDIYPAYVNHAHNDFLELLLESGVLGAAILLFYLVAVALHLFGGGCGLLQRLSFLSVCVVLVHSGVDYPLRTIGVAASFAFSNALFFLNMSGGEPAEKQSAGDLRGTTGISASGRPQDRA